MAVMTEHWARKARSRSSYLGCRYGIKHETDECHITVLEAS